MSRWRSVLAGCATVVDQHLLECGDVHLQVEAVVGILGQDDVEVRRIDAREVALLQQLRHACDEPLLHGLAFLRAEDARVQQVGVGAERLVDLLEVEQLHRIGMAAPVVEIAHEAAGLAGIAVRPQSRLRQPVHQRVTRDRQKFLPRQSRRRFGVRVGHCRCGRRCRGSVAGDTVHRAGNIGDRHGCTSPRRLGASLQQKALKAATVWWPVAPPKKAHVFQGVLSRCGKAG